MRHLRRLYGGGPLHLLGHLVVIAIAGYALSIMFRDVFAPQPWNLVLWLLGGAVLHDFVLLPAYSAVNVAASRAWGGRAGINFIRVPTIVSIVLLLAFLPRIANGQPQNFERALGHAPPDYLGRWLFITALLFAASFVVWGVRRATGAGGGSPTAGSPPGSEGSAAHHGFDQ